MGILRLVPIHLGDDAAILPALGARLRDALRMEAAVARPGFDPEVAYDPVRGQYSSTRLLSLLLGAPRGGVARVLGVAGVDLFIPVLTYVFGEAQLDGAAAVVSTYRLRHEAYGLRPDPEGFLDRLEKEATHELGHTLGIVHCPSLDCVMRSSTYVEEIDLKPAGFCDACRAAAFRGRGAGDGGAAGASGYSMPGITSSRGNRTV